MQLPADAGWHAVGPGALDQHPASERIASFGDPAPPHGGAAGVLGRNQAEIGHQLARIGEAGEVADFRNDRDRDDKSDAAHGLDGLDHGRHRPAWQQDPRSAGSGARPALRRRSPHGCSPAAHLLGGVIEANRRQPASIGERPARLACVNASHGAAGSPADVGAPCRAPSPLSHAPGPDHASPHGPRQEPKLTSDPRLDAAWRASRRPGGRS